MAEQQITLEPGQSKIVSFEAVPAEARTYQVSVNGLTGSFSAVEAAPPSGEILEITWWDGGTWRPISEPMPAATVRYRFRVRNTGPRAAFKVGIYITDPFVGDYWNYSPSVDIEPGEGNIDWNIWTGAPATITVTFHLFANDTEVDAMTVTLRIV